MIIRYHVTAEYNQKSHEIDTKEKGIGSFLYSVRQRDYFSGQAKLLARGWFGQKITVIPNLEGKLNIEINFVRR